MERICLLFKADFKHQPSECYVKRSFMHSFLFILNSSVLIYSLLSCKTIYQDERIRYVSRKALYNVSMQSKDMRHCQEF